ncbi:MAG: hydroxymethylglutaryl-CoA reductase, degradative [Chitinophagaceae bacterium]|nr:hydroxymethylglutaryl-CoA reductase, degradative [Chitinophagaceae bacterium]MCW5906115.1 hydroxymethylglutaryl-CoA reductase, degradative [Chitinophagaceae bacterium]
MKKEQKIVHGFSKKSRDEKLNIVTEKHTNAANALSLFKSFHHSDSKMQSLLEEFSENTISNFPLPFCICPNMLINDKAYMVPMVIEESSVVAAAANSAKFWFTKGGFKTKIIDTEKIGQVHFLWKDDITILQQRFAELKERLIKDCFDITENMVKRGGGIINIELKDLSDKEPHLMQLYATFETIDSMGANFINSCLEQFAATFKQWQSSQKECTKDGLEIIMCILSNYTPNCRVKCYVETTLDQLDNIVPGMNGKEFARRFRLGVRVAELDPHRATTHNKGIMNGIDAVVLATGNDFRAVEACSHTFAAHTGKYTSLSHVDIEENAFRFTVEVPFALGVVGGLTTLHPLVKLSLELLENPSATELMSIAVATGLANNFSAVKNLVTVGIQQGHMKMHLLNILKQLKVPESRKEEVIEHFKDKVVSVSAVRNLAERWSLIETTN